MRYYPTNYPNCYLLIHSPWVRCDHVDKLLKHCYGQGAHDIYMKELARYKDSCSPCNIMYLALARDKVEKDTNLADYKFILHSLFTAPSDSLKKSKQTNLASWWSCPQTVKSLYAVIENLSRLVPTNELVQEWRRQLGKSWLTVPKTILILAMVVAKIAKEYTSIWWPIFVNLNLVLCNC